MTTSEYHKYGRRSESWHLADVIQFYLRVRAREWGYISNTSLMKASRTKLSNLIDNQNWAIKKYSRVTKSICSPDILRLIDRDRSSAKIVDRAFI